MKKFVATLLFFIFANSFFASVFASSNTKNLLELKVNRETVENLNKAGSLFENEYKKFCDEKKAPERMKNYPCRDGFEKTFENSKKIQSIKFEEKNANEFFKVIAGFYEDLKKFDVEEHKIPSSEKISRIEKILREENEIENKLSELVKKVNVERGLLSDLDKKERKKLDENSKSLAMKDLNNYDNDLFDYDKNGVKKHNLKKDISEMPKDLSSFKDEDLTALEQNLAEVNEIIEEQYNLTSTNIEGLKGKQQDDAKKAKEERKKTLDEAWDKLKLALEDEKSAVNNFFDNPNKDKQVYYKKDIDLVSVKTMNNNLAEAKKKGVDLENHIGNSPDKTAISIKNVPTDENKFTELISYLTNETTKANSNAEKLNKAKNKSDEDELTRLKNNLLTLKNEESDLLEVVTGDKKVLVPDFDKAVNELNNSLSKTGVKDMKNNSVDLSGKSIQEQKEILEKEITNVENINKKLNKINNEKKQENKILKNNFKKLAHLMKKIDLLEKAIYTTKDRMTENNNGFEYKLLGYSSDRTISCKDYIADSPSCRERNLNSLSWSVVENSANMTISNEELKNWNLYFEKVISQAETNINNMNNYINNVKGQCNISGYWDNSWTELSEELKKKLGTEVSSSLGGQAGDNSTLIDEFNNCQIQAEIKKCEEYGKYDELKLEYFTKLGVLKVRESCYTNNFKNKCPVKDYNWPVFTENLTYINMKAELNKCNEFVQSKQCNEYLIGAQKIKKISSDGINTEQPIDKCKPHVEETLCKNYSMKNIGYIPEIKAKSGSDTYDYLKECVAAVDKMAIKKDIEKVINDCKPEFNNEEKKTLINKIGSEIKTVKDAEDRCLAHQIQKAVDRCIADGQIIDNYSVKERNYTSVKQVEELCEKMKQSAPKRKSIKDEASSFICLSNAGDRAEIKSLISSISDYCKEFNTSPIQTKGSGSCYINNKRFVDTDPDKIRAGTKPQSMATVLENVLSNLAFKACGRRYSGICESVKAYEGCVK